MLVRFHFGEYLVLSGLGTNFRQINFLWPFKGKSKAIRVTFVTNTYDLTLRVKDLFTGYRLS